MGDQLGAVCPMRTPSMRTMAKLGLTVCAKSTSPKPTTANRPGTAMPRMRASVSTLGANLSALQNTALMSGAST